jgi:hypothetical protein
MNAESFPSSRRPVVQRPVPGDPDAVSAESRRLGQTAQELRAQIALLKQISQDTTLKGQYAGTLRAHAQQLSTDLDKVATRYEDVAEATSEWSGNLADAQAQSLTALNMAQGPYEQLRKLQAPVQPAAAASAAAKQQYATDKQAYQQAQSSAQAAISDAQVLLTRAAGHRDTTGAAAAGKINGAAHDSLADSWWDQFKQEIGAIADNLKTIATIIGYVATVCAILAVILTGPLALVFLLIAGGLLLTELGIHTILAATGNGSWVDVGLDAIAFATLGYGGILDTGAETAEKTASDVAIEAIQEESPLTSASEMIADSANALKEAAAEFGDEEITASANRIAKIAGSIKTSASNLAKSESKEDSCAPSASSRSSRPEQQKARTVLNDNENDERLPPGAAAGLGAGPGQGLRSWHRAQGDLGRRRRQARRTAGPRWCPRLPRRARRRRAR